MLGKLISPKTKTELIKSIQVLRSPKIEVMEVFDRSDKSKVTQHFDKMITKGNFTIIFIKE
jgi:hypothetical protein